MEKGNAERKRKVVAKTSVGRTKEPAVTLPDAIAGDPPREAVELGE